MGAASAEGIVARGVSTRGIGAGFSFFGFFGFAGTGAGVTGAGTGWTGWVLSWFSRASRAFFWASLSTAPERVCETQRIAEHATAQNLEICMKINYVNSPWDATAFPALTAPIDSEKDTTRWSASEFAESASEIL